MSYQISLIDDERITETKGGNLSHVDGVYQIDDLEELAVIGTMKHIAPGTFVDNRKCQANLKSIQFMAFDFDNGTTTSTEVHDLLYRYQHVILGSKNHLRDKDDGKGIVERFHVFIPLSEPVNDIELYKFIGNDFPKNYRWNVDRNCVEPSRYYYKHSHILFVSPNGKPIDVAQYMTIKTMREALHSKYQSMRQKPQEQLPSTEYWKKRVMDDGEMRADGSRYAKSSSFIGKMKKAGLTLGDVLNVFDELGNYGHSFTRKSVERRYMEFS